MPTSTVENYLKHLYVQQNHDAQALVPLGRLATVLGVTPGTVTTMIKTLADSGLVFYEPRTGARLTPGGEQLALLVLRRHRLVELLLVRLLGLDWSQVHDEAEELEHAISDRLLDRIDQVLGYPQFDPHGDPIPTASGQIIQRPMLRLSACEAGRQVSIARVDDQDQEFLRFAADSGLTPGAVVHVLAHNNAADAITITVGDGKEHLTLGSAAAGKIFVE
ncbi:MAG: metal-dependent transcriptional regulator [Phycisphaerales bacterium]|nr:metal-dependent transcriptional regulator [Phycisphaerales bacterium]